MRDWLDWASKGFSALSLVGHVSRFAQPERIGPINAQKSAIPWKKKRVHPWWGGRGGGPPPPPGPPPALRPDGPELSVIKTVLRRICADLVAFQRWSLLTAVVAKPAHRLVKCCGNVRTGRRSGDEPPHSGTGAWRRKKFCLSATTRPEASDVVSVVRDVFSRILRP